MTNDQNSNQIKVYDAESLSETTGWDVLQKAQRAGHLWVALLEDVAVGFAHVELIERDSAHLEEIDVHPAHGRQGLGTQLVVRVCEWAAGNGYASAHADDLPGPPLEHGVLCATWLRDRSSRATEPGAVRGRRR